MQGINPVTDITECRGLNPQCCAARTSTQRPGVRSAAPSGAHYGPAHTLTTASRRGRFITSFAYSIIFLSAELKRPLLVATTMKRLMEAPLSSHSQVTIFLLQVNLAYRSPLPLISACSVFQFHLVCESFDQQALFQITYNVGGIMGSVIGGNIGDKYVP